MGHYEEQTDKPLIICTGDIIESSARKRHFLEAKQLLQKLVDSEFKLLLCPGNHDLKYEGLGPMINGAVRFNNYFASLLPNGHNYYGEEDNELLDFPIVHQFEDLFCIGLNSLQKERGIGATGELGAEQISELQSIISEIRISHPQSRIIVYLHHHPLEFDFRPELMRLKDKDAFLDAVQGIEILLFGHLHFNERFRNDEIRLDINLIHLGAKCTWGRKVRWHEIDTHDFTISRFEYD